MRTVVRTSFTTIQRYRSSPHRPRTASRIPVVAEASARTVSRLRSSTWAISYPAWRSAVSFVVKATIFSVSWHRPTPSQPSDDT
jgi:hypothetical protein